MAPTLVMRRVEVRLLWRVWRTRSRAEIKSRMGSEMREIIPRRPSQPGREETRSWRMDRASSHTAWDEMGLDSCSESRSTV